MRPFFAYPRRSGRFTTIPGCYFSSTELTAQIFAIFALATCFLCSCEKKPETETSNQSPGASQTPPAAPTPPLPPRRKAIWNDFNGERALDTAKTILRFGQRISGTEPLNQLRPYIIEELKRSGWQAEEQRLSEQTEAGHQVEVCSLVAPSGRLPVISPRLVVAAHIDSLDLGIANDPGAS